MSHNPGNTTLPSALKTSAALSCRSRPIDAMRLPSTMIVVGSESVPLRGSKMRAFVIDSRDIVGVCVSFLASSAARFAARASCASISVRVSASYPSRMADDHAET